MRLIDKLQLFKLEISSYTLKRQQKKYESAIMSNETTYASTGLGYSYYPQSVLNNMKIMINNHQEELACATKKLIKKYK